MKNKFCFNLKSMMYSRMFLVPFLLKLIFMISCTTNLMMNVHALRKNDEVVVVELNSVTAAGRVEQQQQQQRQKRMLPVHKFELSQQLDDKQMEYHDVITNMKRHSIDQNHELISINHSKISIEEENNNNNNYISNDIVKRRKLQDFCVRTGAQLCLAISNAPNFSLTRIDICMATMNIEDNCFINQTYKGINVLSKNLDIRCNTTTPPCILDAQNMSRHFYTNQSTIIFRDIVFQNGNGLNDVPTKKDGGSLLLYQSNVSFEMCQFKSNIGFYGGAIASISSSMTLIGGNISNPTLFLNNTSANDGGAIYAIEGNTTITATSGYFVFRDNYAGTNNKFIGNGGAVYVRDGLSSWSNGIFDRNSVPLVNSFGGTNSGGAIYFDEGKTSFTNVMFQNNVGEVGGAVCADDDVEINFLNTTFSKNYAKKWGGAFRCNKCLATFKTTSFIENSVSLDLNKTKGGAVSALRGNLSLIDVIFQGNIAAEGAALEASSVSIAIINVKAINNTSTNYGTILIGLANITLYDSRFKDNRVTNINFTVGAMVYWASKLSFKNNDFSTKQPDSCDALAFNFNKDDGDFREACTNFPTKPPFRRRLTIPTDVIHSRQRSLKSRCIVDRTQLRAKVKVCDQSTSKLACRVDADCKKSGAKTTFNSRAIDDGPIDLSNKDIIFNCITDCPSDRCELDGGGVTQLFSGSNLKATFNNFIFTNSYGSALQIFGGGGSGRTIEKSKLNLHNCSFENNNATSGSAISAHHTDVYMDGSTTSFINNMGNGAPVEFFSSNVTIMDAYFEGNNISEFGSGILAFDSITSLRDVSFAKTTSSRRVESIGSDCDVYVVVYVNKSGLEGSCLKSSETITKPIPDLCSPINIPNTPTPPTPTVPTQTLPTPTVSQPTVPTQTPPILTPLPQPPCFSGWNIVVVKNVGSIQMDQLQIGDFVMSGNGQFTQVYGFGHLDRALEEVFLQIHFDRYSDSQTYIVPPLPLEVSARHLVMLDKVGFQYPIRASDVVVGDILSGMRVRKIENVVRQGVYAPLTQSGDLIVSGIRASSYVDVLNENWGLNQHVLGHMIFFPQRIFCGYFIETCKKEGYINGYGYLSYLVIRVSSVINRFRPFCASIIVPSFLMISTRLCLEYLVGCCFVFWLYRLYFGSYQLKKK